MQTAVEHVADNWGWARTSLDTMLRRVFRSLKPREPLSIIDYIERYRNLSGEESPDFVGRFRLENTPALRGILAVLSERGVRRVVVQKSAQIGYTAGVVCSVLAYHAHWRPCVQVVMFPRVQSAKDFNAEKFEPMVRASPKLSKVIKLKSRALGNSAQRKRYPGGLIKFVASNSPSDVKSTTARVRIVEEPDDTNTDVRGQGNSITLLRERGKAVRDSIELIGGTPTAKGASEIEKEINTTDKRRFLVPCHHCGERHDLHFEHVTIPGLHLSDDVLSDPDIDRKYPQRDVFGRARWEDAFYACPRCGGVWTDQDRVENIKRAASVPPLYGWEPTAASADPGFYCKELHSIFVGSYVPELAKKYLTALHELERGEPEKMIAFQNSTNGESWEYKGELPEEEELAARAEAYAEWTIPAGGLTLLLSVDVQHDRLAVTVWAVGRGEEMWLIYWGELYGQTIVANAGAWVELEQMMRRRVPHHSGAQLSIAAVGIDCSDGTTSDASYAFVRKHHRADRPVLALKGASDEEGRIEIWTPPKKIDPNHRSTKASKYGIQVHIVGTARAKDLILGWATESGRVRLEGSGPGRMHWYQTVRADFFEQLLGEMKIPCRSNPHKRYWKRRTDRRNEALDCTVYALYLSRHLRLHLMRPWQWDARELQLRQVELIAEDVPAPVEPSAPAVALKTDPSAEKTDREIIAQKAFTDMIRERRARHGR